MPLAPPAFVTRVVVSARREVGVYDRETIRRREWVGCPHYAQQRDPAPGAQLGASIDDSLPPHRRGLEQDARETRCGLDNLGRGLGRSGLRYRQRW